MEAARAVGALLELRDIPSKALRGSDSHRLGSDSLPHDRPSPSTLSGLRDAIDPYYAEQTFPRADN